MAIRGEVISREEYLYFSIWQMNSLMMSVIEENEWSYEESNSMNLISNSLTAEEWRWIMLLQGDSEFLFLFDEEERIIQWFSLNLDSWMKLLQSWVSLQKCERPYPPLQLKSFLDYLIHLLIEMKDICFLHETSLVDCLQRFRSAWFRSTHLACMCLSHWLLSLFDKIRFNEKLAWLNADC